MSRRVPTHSAAAVAPWPPSPASSRPARSLVAQLVELLRNERAAPATATTRSSSCSTSPGPTTEPDDPVLARLLPDGLPATTTRRPGSSAASPRAGCATARPRPRCCVIDALEDAGLPAELDDESSWSTSSSTPRRRDLAEVVHRHAAGPGHPAGHRGGRRRALGGAARRTTRAGTSTTSTSGWAACRRPWSARCRADRRALGVARSGRARSRRGLATACSYAGRVLRIDRRPTTRSWPTPAATTRTRRAAWSPARRARTGRSGSCRWSTPPLAHLLRVRLRWTCSALYRDMDDARRGAGGGLPLAHRDGGLPVPHRHRPGHGAERALRAGLHTRARESDGPGRVPVLSGSWTAIRDRGGRGDRGVRVREHVVPRRARRRGHRGRTDVPRSQD